MKTLSLALLRTTLALLLFWWGTDKIMDVGHAMEVSDTFYLGLLSHPGLLPVLGAVQMVLALAFLLGYQRRWVDPLVTLVFLTTAAGVWRSLLDPFGYFLEGTHAHFFPSAVVAAAALLLLASHGDERLVLDRGRGSRKSEPLVASPPLPLEERFSDEGFDDLELNHLDLDHPDGRGRP